MIPILHLADPLIEQFIAITFLIEKLQTLDHVYIEL